MPRACLPQFSQTLARILPILVGSLANVSYIIFAEAKEELTPDSSKSTQQKVKETATDTTDRVARGTMPDDQKSNTQAAFDKTQRTHDDQQGGAASSM